MRLADLADRLDEEFGIANQPENLTEFGVVDANRALINPSFLQRHTALMLHGSEEVREVISVVFVTDAIVEQLAEYRDCIVFSHHHCDCYEDERGLQPIRAGQFDKLLQGGHSLYIAHAPLDLHPVYGTSRVLAELIGVQIESGFFEYFGSPVGRIGRVEPTIFYRFAETVRAALQRPCVTEVYCGRKVEKIAVAAGGGDIPQVLEEAAAAGCDTLVTGTVEHRWNISFAQENNRRFHELNRQHRLNLVGGTHYGTERPAMMAVLRMFEEWQVPARFMEDKALLNAL